MHGHTTFIYATCWGGNLTWKRGAPQKVNPHKTLYLICTSMYNILLNTAMRPFDFVAFLDLGVGHLTRLRPAHNLGYSRSTIFPLFGRIGSMLCLLTDSDSVNTPHGV